MVRLDFNKNSYKTGICNCCKSLFFVFSYLLIKFLKKFVKKLLTKSTT